MAFEEGREKTGGRTKGGANKNTTVIRDAFSELLKGNLDIIKEDFKTLEPKERIKLFLDMSKYIIPTLKATELDLGDKTLDKFNKPLAEFFGIEDK
jgi:hypothetical protein